MSMIYLLASLPVLKFIEKPPLTVNEFLKMCREQLSDREAVIMERLLAPRPGGTHPLVLQWLDFNHQIRNELAWFRSEKFNKNPEAYVQGPRDHERAIVDAVSIAAEADNPLAAEKIIDQLRWETLEDYGRFRSFELESVMVYGLKLRILERYHTVASDRGAQAFAAMKAQSVIEV